MKTPKINTRCPACRNSTLIIDHHDNLVCSLIGCPDPTLINRIGSVPVTGYAPFDVPVAGHRFPLRVTSLNCECGQIEGGVSFEFANEGGWVVALETLERIVALAHIQRRQHSGHDQDMPPC